MARISQKVISDLILGNIVFRKKAGCRRISIRVHPVKGVSVSVPFLVPYAAAEAFFRLKRSRIIDIAAKQKSQCAGMPEATPELISGLRLRAKAELPARLAELASHYGFQYNRVAIKHNSTNWGSCSAKNNINLNLNLVRLPRVLSDYVMIHELCHLRHHDHGQAFHLLLEHLCTDNVLRLSDEGDELARELASRAAVSKARYPLDYVISRELKKWRLI